jgi:hypothetical protein
MYQKECTTFDALFTSQSLLKETRSTWPSSKVTFAPAL